MLLKLPILQWRYKLNASIWVTSKGAFLLDHECRLFKLRCLEVPIENRISFRSLLEAVESAVIEEAKWRPRGPLYMVGEGFGGAVALAVAARNPDLDLVLILVNPATSFPESPLQSLLPLFYNSPWDHDFVAPLLLNFIVGKNSFIKLRLHASQYSNF